MTTIVRIPAPPSTNNLFYNASGKGRVKTDRYRTWLSAAGWSLKEQRPVSVPGRVRISILMRQPRANADIDNRFKAPLDLLVLHGVIDDDKNVCGASIEWADVDDCIVTVTAAA